MTRTVKMKRNQSARRTQRVMEDSWKSFSEYSQDSTIHSMHYIGKRNMHWSGRVFWALAFVVSLSACLYLGSQTFIRWRQNPIITTYDQRLSHISEIPLPAITICFRVTVDENKFNETNIYSRLEKNESFTEEEELIMNIVGDMCFRSHLNFVKHPMTNSNASSADFIKCINRITKEYADIVIFQEFIRKPFREVFRRTLTDPFGLCHTYNMAEDDEMFTSKVARSFIDHDDGEYNNSELPKSLSASGFFNGIEINVLKNSNIFCSNHPGFILHLHSPYDYPAPPKNMILVPPHSFSQVIVDPEVIFTPEELRKYDINVRQCYFSDEKELKYFKIYSYTNCELECEVDHHLKLCGCLRYFTIHRENTRMCQTWNETQCLINSYFELQKHAKKCDCMPACNDVQYKFKLYHQSHNETSDETNGINIYFGSDQFVRMKRVEVFGIVEFLSSCGGFLGLLMGGSLLSVVEIVYNFCMKRHLEKKDKRNGGMDSEP